MKSHILRSFAAHAPPLASPRAPPDAPIPCASSHALTRPSSTSRAPTRLRAIARIRARPHIRNFSIAIIGTGLAVSPVVSRVSSLSLSLSLSLACASYTYLPRALHRAPAVASPRRASRSAARHRRRASSSRAAPRAVRVKHGVFFGRLFRKHRSVGHPRPPCLHGPCPPCPP